MLFFILFLILVVAFCIFVELTKGKCRSTRLMHGKLVIVTGANSGIGKETVLDLAKRGARVIMACRNLQSANQIRDEISSEVPSAEIRIEELNLSSFKSVRKFAKKILATEDHIDVLIHNAGIYSGTLSSDQRLNDEGIEITFATNHLGPFLLTNLLIDLMNKAPNGCRIVIVSSNVSLFERTNFEEFFAKDLITKYSCMKNYAISKYANVLFTKELARRLMNTRVTVNALHPGIVKTNMLEKVEFYYKIFFSLFQIFFKTPREGAQTQIYLAVDEEVEDVSGRYFMSCREFDHANTCEDVANARILWSLSRKLVSLDPSDEIHYPE